MHDVAIVGAGMVGGTLAALLARCGFSVCLVEREEPVAFDAQQDVGLRVSAISPGSASILSAAGAWESIESERHGIYRQMHVEDATSGGTITFDSPAFGLERLGTIVENALVQQALWQQLSTLAGVEVECPSSVTAVTSVAGGVALELDRGGTVQARLLVAADGAQSGLRRMLGIEQDCWSYNQSGVVCVVRKQEANPGIAWQRFFGDAPLAFLPLADGRSSIVWTCNQVRARELLAETAGGFAEALDEASRGWLGSVVEVGPRAAFPLQMRHSHSDVAGRAVLLGDAAHVVHPLAGQGVNLGLADAAALLEMLLSGPSEQRDPGERPILERYARWRRSEGRIMSGGIHALRALFAHDSLAGVRGLGMRWVGRSWFARDRFVRRAIGQGSGAPALARGQSLVELQRKSAA
ncbi:MAG: FAD-dependent monooxygenase [Xanthomonadales bacterium]|nr:FAD-dependent monooxygenase [Xanthomonadales bacterium]